MQGVCIRDSVNGDCTCRVHAHVMCEWLLCGQLIVPMVTVGMQGVCTHASVNGDCGHAGCMHTCHSKCVLIRVLVRSSSFLPIHET